MKFLFFTVSISFQATMAFAELDVVPKQFNFVSGIQATWGNVSQPNIEPRVSLETGVSFSSVKTAFVSTVPSILM